MFLLGMVQQNAVAIFTCRQRRTSDIGRWFSSFWSASHRSNHGSSSWCCMETLWDISTTKFLGSTAIVNGGSNLDLLKTIVDAGSLHNQNVSSPWNSNKFFPMIQKVVLFLADFPASSDINHQWDYDFRLEKPSFGGFGLASWWDLWSGYFPDCLRCVNVLQGWRRKGMNSYLPTLNRIINH